ncbi:xanthine dehydrogenase accessory protein XdhC [Alteromonas pelagimontana]|uniref:Xanthine dehydrogenase accessory protein XdhC n=1 Tax=Alteromonas pelagimontana TaxID=1858656 RepID=A0A6M4M8T4_9ALTE|nr:xanthine dehydrogenase accessory protein XdhC [Alteromonas pelagimontana]QJR79547.1 xanthine dehydrogenase accessory protein XdhC [Alteromonas pelagimontana]
MKPTTWFDALHQSHQRGESYVLVTVLTVAGSAPREAGTKMVVTAATQYDTIGGGHLEYIAIDQARTLLAANQEQQHIESFPLSAKLGQCCGGAVKLLFEVKVQHCQHVAVFGAGHVAKALVPLLAQLPLQILWIDSRAAEFQDMNCPANVRIIIDDDPVGEITALPENCWLIILTHDHQLDYALVDAALKANRFEYIGMIGSDTKARRFRTRLLNKGYSKKALHRLVSPIGDPSIGGKRPIEVAISIGAQIIRRLHDCESEPGLLKQKNDQVDVHDLR